MQSIKNTNELRRALAAGRHDYRLRLNDGLCSRKTITLSTDGRFEIENHIDGSEQTLTGRELYFESNIGKGMRKGAFVAE